jgi:S1-C subfamily serine protease
MLKIGKMLLFCSLLPGLCSAPALAETPQEGGWLGLWLGDAMDGGAQVMALVSRGPAHRAGVRSGDVIVGVGEREVANQQVLGAILAGSRPGDELTLSLLRAGRALQVDVVLETRPADAAGVLVPRAPRAPRSGRFAVVPEHRLESQWPELLSGVEVTEITPALREHYGAPSSAGVLVVAVDGSGEAEAVDLEVGDVVVRLAGEEIRDGRQLERALRAWSWDRALEIQVVREGEPRSLLLEPSASALERDAAIEAELAYERARLEREVIEKRLQAEIERLERRLAELNSQLERLREED